MRHPKQDKPREEPSPKAGYVPYGEMLRKAPVLHEPYDHPVVAVCPICKYLCKQTERAQLEHRLLFWCEVCKHHAVLPPCRKAGGEIGKPHDTPEPASWLDRVCTFFGRLLNG